MEGTQKEYRLPIEDQDIGTTKVVKEIDTGDKFYISFRLDITYLSDEIWKKVEYAIEEEKKNPLLPLKTNKHWHSDKSENIEFFIFVLLIWVDGNGISYYIDGAFRDDRNESLEAYLSIPVDLHRYNGAVRTLVHQYVDDTFFNGR